MRVMALRARDSRAGLTGGQVAVIGVALVLVVCLVAGSAFVISARTNGAAASTVQAQPGAVPWNGRDRMTMLLIGKSDSAAGARADSLVIASYDRASRSLNLLSIPATLWVTIPGFGPDTISQAYADGGPRLALIVAQSATHAVIPYYAAIDPSTARRLVDVYGGLRVGRKRLDGTGALRYAGAGNDTTRMADDQHLILGLLRQAIQPQSLFQLPSIIDGIGGSIDTNFPYDQLPALAHQLSAVGSSHIHAASLGYGNGSVTDYSTNGRTVLLPDWQHIHQAVASALGPTPGGTGHVEVLNGSGIPGAAQTLSGWLAGIGVHVSRYASADTSNYSHTHVLVAPRASVQERLLARSTAALLEAPLATGTVRKSVAPVVVIIGGDFQDPTQQ